MPHIVEKVVLIPGALSEPCVSNGLGSGRLRFGLGGGRQDDIEISGVAVQHIRPVDIKKPVRIDDRNALSLHLLKMTRPLGGQLRVRLVLSKQRPRIPTTCVGLPASHSRSPLATGRWPP